MTSHPIDPHAAGVHRMALRIAEQERNGITTVILDGPLVVGEGSNALRNKIKMLLAAKKTRIILDVHKVTSIDSAGVGTLAVCYHSARSVGASLKMTSLDTRSREVLVHVNRLLAVFDAYDCEPTTE